ncbi:isocitrate lyase/phosphoenolpyruvate mutase family protein [Breoghania sp. L-A4]|uniref:isocitrate lyase/PEP mutase family protein n=1 Tax=Breoghania sp. L-A4 TaxID=2304600 RepID=UPI000E360C18|nr:isocitrate lyase/phosphoenolpyruvate mutase family protein [Breoghania sp. L-A4]AXS41946.1 isocitrate lyase/phosphoenolpyruvate mutase family protein [Breoghania sp. L-A4]
MSSADDKAKRFRKLHERDGVFVMPNPWDAGTARILAAHDFEALATTSAGLAFSLGRPDSEWRVSRNEAMAHAKSIVDATELPVSADLESGFGDTPEEVAETIQQAMDIGLAGASIEDASGDPAEPLYDITLATERIEAARAVIDKAQSPFVLTARAESVLIGQQNALENALRRIRAFEKAGADVVYVPGLLKSMDIHTVTHAVSVPVNALAGIGEKPLTVDKLESLGVKRISLGSVLSRAAMGAFLRAAQQIRDHGTFDFAHDAAAFEAITELLRPWNESRSRSRRGGST